MSQPLPFPCFFPSMPPLLTTEVVVFPLQLAPLSVFLAVRPKFFPFRLLSATLDTGFYRPDPFFHEGQGKPWSPSPPWKLLFSPDLFTGFFRPQATPHAFALGLSPRLSVTPFPPLESFLPQPPLTTSMKSAGSFNSLPRSRPRAFASSQTSILFAAPCFVELISLSLGTLDSTHDPPVPFSVPQNIRCVPLFRSPPPPFSLMFGRLNSPPPNSFSLSGQLLTTPAPFSLVFLPNPDRSM